MKRVWSLIVVSLSVLLLTSCANVDKSADKRVGVERIYVLYCGEGTAPDQGRWSPGVNVGKPMALSNSCYLIKHASGWLLWETGFTQEIAGVANGYPTPVIHWRWTAPKNLIGQLAEIGVAPQDITHLGFTHAHPDHIGNGSLFPTSTLFIQKAEWEFYLGPKGKPPGPPANFARLRNNPTVQLEGDHDVFGDGTVMILATPGHTPGHQSLLVKLPKTGAVVLSGDAAHFKDNYDNRRAPVQNFNRDQTLASMNKLSQVVAAHKAQLWINHDVEQTAKLVKAPASIE